MNRVAAWAFVVFAPLLVACGPPKRIGLYTTEASTALTQVTRGTGEQHPAIARDGRSLAYDVVGAASAPRVEVLALAPGATPRAIGPSSEPTWLPGAGGLVCVSRAERAKAQLVQTFGEGAASAFDAPLGQTLVSAGWPAASPDGQWVAVSFGNAHVYETHARRLARFLPALALVAVRGTGTVALGDGAEPSWSPDGASLAFVRPIDGRAHLFVSVARRNAAATQLTVGADDDAQPAWSPDGSLIAFCSSPVSNGIAKRSNLFAVRPDGSGLRQLTEGDANACRPAWGPDGSLYFHANADGRYHIWRIRIIQ